MRQVTSGITTVIQEHITFAVALGNLRGHKAFVLLGVGIADKTFLRLEVKRHRVRLIRIFTHLEYRRTKLLTRRVHRTCGMYQTGIERHVYLVTLQVHILILHVRLTIEVGNSRLSVVCHRVLSRIFHRRIDTVLALAISGVGGQRVIDSLVALPDKQLQRVHRGSIGDVFVDSGTVDYSTGAHNLLDGVAINIVDHNVANHNAIHPSNALGKAQPRHFRHHKDDDEKQQKYERFSSHGCKGTTF